MKSVQIKLAVRVAALLSVVVIGAGCKSLTMKSVDYLQNKDYTKAIATADQVPESDAEYAGAQSVAAQAYFGLYALTPAGERCQACLDAAARKLNENPSEYSSEFNHEIQKGCMALAQKIRDAVWNLPENVAKRSRDRADSQQHQAEADAEHAKVLAKDADAMKPYWEKAKQILKRTINLQDWVDRDERLSETYRPEQEVKLVSIPSDAPGCVNVAVHLVPRENWRQIRMDTTVEGGATPSQAREWVQSWKPTPDTVWATFKVEVKTGDVRGVDSWAKTIITAQNSETERRDYLKGR
jgi:hypothetical protein